MIEKTGLLAWTIYVCVRQLAQLWQCDNKISANRTLENHLKKVRKKLSPNALIQSITKLFNSQGIKPIWCHLSCLEAWWSCYKHRFYVSHFSLHELGAQEKVILNSLFCTLFALKGDTHIWWEKLFQNCFFICAWNQWHRNVLFVV